VETSRIGIVSVREEINVAIHLPCEISECRWCEKEQLDEFDKQDLYNMSKLARKNNYTVAQMQDGAVFAL
jgi:hypothetical protein